MATKADRFPKQYFNAAMVKAKPLVLVIDEETYEPITDRKTGKTTEKSVLSFQNIDTKLLLNATNFDLVCEATGESDSANWGGHEIELYCDRTNMGSDRVDCVRVRAPTKTQKKKTAKPALVLPAREPEAEEPDADPLGNEDAATLRAKGNADLDDDIPF
jgi:hypothetical protein